jgi:hypothetical protein
MKTTREQFEEIWPVPAGIAWSDSYGEYMPFDRYNCTNAELACEWDARLDTFTRCQEATDVYVSLVDELIESLSYANNWVKLNSEVAIIEGLLRKANKTRSVKK